MLSLLVVSTWFLAVFRSQNLIPQPVYWVFQSGAQWLLDNGPVLPSLITPSKIPSTVAWIDVIGSWYHAIVGQSSSPFLVRFLSKESNVACKSMGHFIESLANCWNSTGPWTSRFAGKSLSATLLACSLSLPNEVKTGDRRKRLIPAPIKLATKSHTH